MVTPTYFAYDSETEATNVFQHSIELPDSEVRLRVYQEYGGAAAVLRASGVEVIELEPPPGCPDAVFPNNWFSTHAGGALLLYPMQTTTRRKERRLAGQLCTELATRGWNY